MLKANWILFLILTFVVAANAQEKPQTAVSTNTNYEAILQLVAASNDSSQKNSTPPNLENITRQIKNDFGYSSYRVILNSLNRVNNNGSLVEAKGLTETTVNANAPTFYEISFGFGNKQTGNEPPTSLQNVEGKFNLSNFHLGFRVPVAVRLDATDSTKTVFNYEQVGISNNKLTLSQNEPTIIGTMTTSRADELLILVMTVREAKTDNRNLAKKR